MRIGEGCFNPQASNHSLYLIKLLFVLLSWGKLRQEPATRCFDWSFAPIRKFEDRFARQNPCEPPPEFLLASPYSRIVQHLSGPTSCALTQIHPRTSGSVDGAPVRAPTSVHFHCACGFDTRTLAQMVDSLVRVSRRAACGHYASILADARTSVPAGRIVPRAITLRRATFPWPLSDRQN